MVTRSTPQSRPPYVPNGTGRAHALLANLIKCPPAEAQKFWNALEAEVRRLRGEVQ